MGLKSNCRQNVVAYFIEKLSQQLCRDKQLELPKKSAGDFVNDCQSLGFFSQSGGRL